MGEVAGALAILSATGTALSGFQQSKAIKSESKFQAQTYANNAAIADAQAQDAIARGEQEAVRHKTQVKKLIGSQRAALAAQGIDIESGSALDIQADTAALGAEDEKTIRNNAWREAWGYRVQAQDYRTAGEFTKLSAKNKARNVIATAGMNIVSDSAKSYYAYKAGKEKD